LINCRETASEKAIIKSNWTNPVFIPGIRWHTMRIFLRFSIMTIPIALLTAGCSSHSFDAGHGQKAAADLHVKLTANGPMDIVNDSFVWRVPVRIVTDGREMISGDFDHKGEYAIPLERQERHWIQIYIAGTSACSFGIDKFEETWVNVGFWPGRIDVYKRTKVDGKYQFQYEISNTTIVEF